MTENEEISDKHDIKIPVFSVLRNGCALKNIFLTGPKGEIREEYENMPVLMGRHPDNHITLDHPSISRFHLEIFVKTSIQKISIVDRSSVHGTWISGTKIEPNAPVDIKEGDILRLGTSTREYKLQWLSFKEAYEMDNPLPPIIEEKEEAHQEDIHQLDLIDQDEITTNCGCEEDNSLELGKVQQSPMRKDFADTGLISGPVLPESECTGTVNRDSASECLLLDLVGIHPISDQSLPGSESNGSGTSGKYPSHVLDIAGNSMISEPVLPESESFGSILKATASNLLPDSSDKAPTSEPAPPASESVQSIRKETPSSLLSRRPKSKSVSSLSIQTGITKVKAQKEEASWDLCELSGAKEMEPGNEEIFESDKENMTPASLHGKRNKAARKAMCMTSATKQHADLAMNSSTKLSTPVMVRKGVKKTAVTLCISGRSNLNGGSVSLQSREMVSEAKENESCASTSKEKVVPKLFPSRSVKKSRKNVRILRETMHTDRSSSDGLQENENSSSTKANGTVQGSVRNGAKKCEETVHTLEETTQVAQSVAQVLFENCGGDETFASDKENVTPITSNGCKYRSATKSPARASFQNMDFGVEEENVENFASDKENCTPDSKLKQKLRQPIGEDNDILEIEIGERKEVERVPFHVLFDNNVRVHSNSPLRPLSTIPDDSSVCGPQQQMSQEKAREPRKEWVMVVDTGCLLGEESIKAIKLLQGLRGTCLIIPRIVIRELDCMKRREGLFRRPNKQASLILEWIEECMEKEPLWIHVQSSLEAVPVVPTPPITPTSLFGDAGADAGSGFRSDLNAIFSPRGTFMEIVTPTSDDHVLECALLFKKLRGDAHIVLLSSSTTLKIKAMAEGLLCEEANDFKNSLTNPFSKRFMWASSSSKGPTWQRTSDAVAIADNCISKENNPVIARRAFKAAEAIKGLKLILLHNSQYAQTSLVS